MASWKAGGRNQAQAGFTLVEMLIATVLLSILMGSLFSLVINAQRDHVRQRDVGRAGEMLSAAETTITTILRSAKADPYETGLALLDPDPLNHAQFDNLRVVSDFNPADGDFNDLLEDVQLSLASDSLMVRWQAGSVSRPFAYPVNKIEFEYYESDGTKISSAALVNTRATSVKVVLEVDKGPRSTAAEKRETWVFLRNQVAP